MRASTAWSLGAFFFCAFVLSEYISVYTSNSSLPGRQGQPKRVSSSQLGEGGIWPGPGNRICSRIFPKDWPQP